MSGKKIDRKYLAHYINVGESGETWERLGKDLEALSVEMNPNIVTVHNILGEASTDVTYYEKSATVDSYVARQGTGLFTMLQKIIDGELVLDDVKTTALEVHMWEESSGSYTAIREDVVIAVNSYGGDNSGYGIPFTLHYVGNRVKGKFNPGTKAFTEGNA